MTIELGVQLERDCALEDAKEFIDERGDTVVISSTIESGTTRDKYGSIKNRTVVEYTMNGYPIIFDPTQGQMEKAGIKENVDVIVYLAQLDFTNNSISIKDIDDIRWRIRLKGKTFSIKEYNPLNMMADTYLNIVLGLFEI